MSRADRIARTAAHAIASRIEAGRIELIEDFPGGETVEFGPVEATLRSTVLIRDASFYRDLLRSKSIALGEGYAAGRWTTTDLMPLLRILARDIHRADPIRARMMPFLRPLQRLSTLRMLNTRNGARKHIAAHYDLGNDMFEAFLDRESMMYSSALYEHPEQTLEGAQATRLDRICDWLDLRSDDHLLEIGTGWGGLAIHAAARTGCKVTTTTISREQREYAEAKVRAAGLEDRISVIGDDYRDLKGQYEKLVSLEMIEAVGWEWFDTYFQRCSELLRPDGLFFLQAIVIDDGAYEAEKRTRTFANQVIFPGGCLPSLASIQSSIAAETNLRTVRLEDISDSYVLTLRDWRRRFEASAEQLEAMGYDEHFRRLWSFYLSFSEAGFQEARIRDIQVLFAKPERVMGSPALLEAPALIPA